MISFPSINGKITLNSNDWKVGWKMAKYIYETTGDFDKFVTTVRDLAQDISATTNYEDGHQIGNTSSLMVFERYSIAGSSRVSLSVMITEIDGMIQLVAMPSGGSQAITFKLNNIGEEAFLQRFKESLETCRKTW